MGKYSNYTQDELNIALVNKCRHTVRTTGVFNLITLGADVNADVYINETGTNMTPLIAACYNKKKPKIVRLLLKHGADPNKTSEWSRLRAIQAACRIGGTDFAPIYPNINIINTLIEYGAKFTEDEVDEINWLVDGCKSYRLKHTEFDLSDLLTIQNKYCK